jgi:hypothetical protein
MLSGALNRPNAPGCMISPFAPCIAMTVSVKWGVVLIARWLTSCQIACSATTKPTQTTQNRMEIEFSLSDIKTDFSRGELPFKDMDKKQILVRRSCGSPEIHPSLVSVGEILCYEREGENVQDGEVESGITLLMENLRSFNPVTVSQCRIALPRDAISRITRASDPAYDYVIDLTDCTFRDTTPVGTN